MRVAPPAGYVRIGSADGRADGVALEGGGLARSIADVVSAGTLYEHAAAAAGGRTLGGGRGPAYAISIGGVPAVVRHVRHGGLLAPVTRDLFLPPTRAPYELATSIRLRDAGVATPEVLAYAVYRAGPGLRRADVVTREIPAGRTLAACVAPPVGRGELSVDQQAVWHAVRVLIDALGKAGAFHADLNVANVLITGAGSAAPTAYALDIDRVIWRRAGDPTVARDNAARLRRSAEKQRLV